ncbi:mitochondrial TIM23 translocase of inner membrane Tim23 subunit (core translocase) [Andalucia godoyi]|uniref:Mitochondrial TIM23 translocase of inner membrane Tim23 subunit (Core translocase) n=1 Tax=Andalucia godoyi TaxID=505711 RepID=A0A8K0AIH0_ANDGO|nr:mitochondrial TIM23 translocase of inner membrane Tim23 subunit (core translocase) [Andalucia godoyi]|eukprot:ANDGO_07130.mRNA.1 mitochondrial TIM23 translocase of inner membrane Tim23 subunit (core translocase)
MGWFSSSSPAPPQSTASGSTAAADNQKQEKTFTFDAQESSQPSASASSKSSSSVLPAAHHDVAVKQQSSWNIFGSSSASKPDTLPSSVSSSTASSPPSSSPLSSSSSSSSKTPIMPPSQTTATASSDAAKRHNVYADPLAAAGGIRAAAVAPALGVYSPRQAEFIDLDSGGGNFDKITYRVGISYLAGLAVGGGFGLLEGVFLGQKDNARLWLNSILNASSRRGPRAANALGVVSFLFCMFEWAGSYVRDREDGWNTVIGAAAAGAFYKSSAGIRSATGAALVGAGLGSSVIGAQFVREYGLDYERALEDAKTSIQELVESMPSFSGSKNEQEREQSSKKQ